MSAQDSESLEEKNYFHILFIVIFIPAYLLYIVVFFILPNNCNVSIVYFIGIAVIIISFFIFINMKHKEENQTIVSFKIFSENSIKLILILLMSISLFIPPVSNSSTIISWNKVATLNYFKAFIIIIGCAFLPGSCLYNIFFSKEKLHERFKVEPFLLKITIYPILSFSFIGIAVLIIDQTGISDINLFTSILFLTFLALFFIDFIIQYFRKKTLNYNINTISASKYTIIILLVSFGVILIALGVHLGVQYLIPGDSWVGLSPTRHVSRADSSPIDWGRDKMYYPIFWAYIIFGLKILGGLPIINTNALLFPFCYLFVTSTYLLMKAILFDFKEKFAIFATLVITTFSGLFYFTANSTNGNLPAITYVCQFYFIYKSFSFFIFFLVMALFIILIKTTKNNIDITNKKFFQIRESKLLLLISFLIILSFMLYAIPLLIGMIFIFIYCLFSKKRMQNFRFFSHFILFLTLIFVMFDIIMYFYLSSATLIMIQYFFLIALLFQNIPSFLLVYSILSSLFVLSIIIQLIYSKYYRLPNRLLSKYKVNSKNIFKYCIFIFTIFLVIEIISIVLEELVLKYKLGDKIIFFYFLDNIFFNIGIIGILAVYLSYYCFLKTKRLFFTLIICIVLTILIASTLIFLNSFNSASFFVKDIGKENYFNMNFWFNRIWYYSVIPLCVLFTIGLKQYITKINLYPKFKTILINKNKKNFMKVSFLALLITLSYSNLIIAGSWAGNENNRPREEELDIINWMSDNLPENSHIMVEYVYILRLGAISMTDADIYYISDGFSSDDNNAELIEGVEYLMDDKIKYLLISKEFLYDTSNLSKFFHDYLIPYYYYEVEYNTENYKIYSTPLLD